MRLRVSHETIYTYTEPPSVVIQTLRMTPRSHEGQYIVAWRIDVPDTCRLEVHDDAFGNITHAFTLDGPLTSLRVAVEGEVDTHDTHGIVRRTVEPFPPNMFLRETPLTVPDPAIIAFARDICGGEQNALARMHALMTALNKEITFDTDPTHAATTAGEAFALRRGVCQDITHVFIAAARALGHPARYIGGYFHRADGVIQQEAGHAWAEVHISDLGWVAFDPTNGICSTDAHVRVAVGLDYLGAAPVRGARAGGGNEALAVEVRVAQTSRQSQS